MSNNERFGTMPGMQGAMGADGASDCPREIKMGSTSQEKTRTEYIRQREQPTQRPTYKRENTSRSSVWLWLKGLSRACQEMRQPSFSVCFSASCLEDWPRVSLAFSTTLV